MRCNHIRYVFCIVYYSGDFTVQFNHGPNSDVSVFQLLHHTASVMLKKSNKMQTKTGKINVYCRILWSKCVLCIIKNNLI